MISGIYIIRNLWNGKIYVGSSVDIKTRWKTHIARLNRKKHPTSKLQRAWNKYGQTGFEFRIIEVTPPELLIEREQYWIDTTMSCSLGYNTRPKADSCLGLIRGTPTVEHRKKNAEAHRGEKNPHFGKPRPAEVRDKISAAQKGRPRSKHSDATKVQMSTSQKRRYAQGITEEHRQQLAAARKNRVYKPHSEETRNKMREAHAARRVVDYFVEKTGTNVAPSGYLKYLAATIRASRVITRPSCRR